MAETLRRWMPAVLVGMLVTSGAPVARALSVTLTDESSSVQLDPDSPLGIHAWSVNGTVHLNQQWFWVRAGDDTQETSLDALPHAAPLLSDTDGDGDSDTAFVSFLDEAERFQVNLAVRLEGAPFAPLEAGSRADIVKQLTVTNLGAAPLALSLFEYTDVDLFLSAVDDSVLLEALAAEPSSPIRATVTDSSGLGRFQAVVTPEPTTGEAALFDATLASLEDAATTTLDGTLAAGVGDITWALEWQTLLPGGGSLIISQDQLIEIEPVPVPEPGPFRLAFAASVALAAAAELERRRAVPARGRLNAG